MQQQTTTTVPTALQMAEQLGYTGPAATDFWMLVDNPPSDLNFTSALERAPTAMIRQALDRAREDLTERGRPNKTRIQALERHLRKRLDGEPQAGTELEAAAKEPAAADPASAPLKIEEMVAQGLACASCGQTAEEAGGLVDGLCLACTPDTLQRQCVGCGCLDSLPCEGGCAWIWTVDKDEYGRCDRCGVGVALPASSTDTRPAELHTLDAILNAQPGSAERWARHRAEGLTDAALREAIVASLDLDGLPAMTSAGDELAWRTVTKEVRVSVHAGYALPEEYVVTYGDWTHLAKGKPYPIVWINQPHPTQSNGTKGARLLRLVRELYSIPNPALADGDRPGPVQIDFLTDEARGYANGSAESYTAAHQLAVAGFIAGARGEPADAAALGATPGSELSRVYDAAHEAGQTRRLRAATAAAEASREMTAYPGAAVAPLDDTDLVCTACRWRGGHSPTCDRRDEPWPTLDRRDAAGGGDDVIQADPWLDRQRKRIERIADAGGFELEEGPAIPARSSREAPAPASSAAALSLDDPLFGLMQQLGMMKAFAFQEASSRVFRLMMLRQVKEEGLYERLGLTWAQFCKRLPAGMSRRTVDEDIQNLDAFGQEFLEAADELGIGRRALRALRSLPADAQPKLLESGFQIGDRVIPLDRQEEVREALEDLTAEFGKFREQIAKGQEQYVKLSDDNLTLRQRVRELEAHDDVTEMTPLEREFTRALLSLKHAIDIVGREKPDPELVLRWVRQVAPELAVLAEYGGGVDAAAAGDAADEFDPAALREAVAAVNGPAARPEVVR